MKQEEEKPEIQRRCFVRWIWIYKARLRSFREFRWCQLLPIREVLLRALQKPCLLPVEKWRVIRDMSIGQVG